MVNITNIIVSALGSTGIVVDESWVYLSEFGVISDVDALIAQDSSALSFGCLEVHIFRIVDNLSE